MSKADVIDKHVSEYVIMPDSITTSFSKWWSSLPPEHVVHVRHPQNVMGMQENLLIRLRRRSERNFFDSLTTIPGQMDGRQIQVALHYTFYPSSPQFKLLSQVLPITKNVWQGRS